MEQKLTDRHLEVFVKAFQLYACDTSGRARVDCNDALLVASALYELLTLRRAVSAFREATKED